MGLDGSVEGMSERTSSRHGRNIYNALLPPRARAMYDVRGLDCGLHRTACMNLSLSSIILTTSPYVDGDMLPV